jgi:D-alanyl-D-alanine carboxypeptidase/D-alanyl-D-alanine-endopeptidase (penicillin-binding protein 4)
MTKRLVALVVCLAAADLPAARASVSRHHATPAPVKQARVAETAPEPPPDDRDHDRIVRMQTALREILHDSALRRTRVGMRVIEARTGRLFFDTRGTVLMDPASNQKVLATTTALMRLGADWRFRTELTGAAPTADGVVVGDVYLRGSGDPTVGSPDFDAMAAELARRGVRSIAGAVVADPRRLGADEPVADEEVADDDGASATAAHDDDAKLEALGQLSPRVPLVVNHGLMLVRIRPAAEAGLPAEVTTTPADPSFIVHDTVRTKARGHSRVTVRLSVAGARIQIDVDGRIGLGRGALIFRRRVPHQALFAAALMRASLASAGVAVRDDARVEPTPPLRSGRARPLLALHESAPLGILLRKINKDSENDYAERVLEAAGAEVYGGAPTGEKGVHLLREVIGELGLPPSSYVSRNGSGLGHANRITANAMAALLRSLYLDPRVGPELLQSLSVGGVDGTTRNRFKGTLAAERVRAKTGTLRGKSCLSGLVGDGRDVLAFSILVEGLHGRSLAAVRGAQVTCVNAMMRYVREAHGVRPDLRPETTPSSVSPDLEPGQEVGESEEELPAPAAAAPASAAPASAAPPPTGAGSPGGAKPSAPTALPRFIPAGPH